MRIAVLVANADDELARAVHQQLHRAGVRAERFTPQQMADVALTIDAYDFDSEQPVPRVDGKPLGAVVWLVRPDGPLSHGWADDDRAFVDAETRSTWLAVLDHPEVLAINSFDADMWFEGATWPACRRALHVAGAEQATIGYGTDGIGSWLPFQARQTRRRPAPAAVSSLSVPGVGNDAVHEYLTLFGEVIPMHASTATATDSKTEAATQSAAHALQRCGIQLACLFANAHGVVRWVDPLPQVPVSLTPHVAHRIAESIHAHLSGR